MPEPRPARGAAFLVFVGIFASRAFGLVRTTYMASSLGASGSVAADAFSAAFRIPNMVQNLLGEGALSASFIPVYARLLAEGDEEEASRVAGAVAAWLGVAVAVAVAVGVALTPQLVSLIATGFNAEQRDLTITLTRIMFPGSGLFVLSAWCLGIQNSHRRFLLSYAAPVIWNVTMIAAILAFRDIAKVDLAQRLAVASVIGAALQLAIQIPTSLKLLGRLGLSLDRTSENVRSVGRTLGPALTSRGVVQISSFIDQQIASWLPVGMTATIGYATQLYTLPVSLFGMSISAAELPEMSRLSADPDAIEKVRARLQASLRQVSFLVVPSAVAFLALGDVIAGLVFQRGHFTAQDTQYTWAILAGSAIGLLANTLSRVYSSTFFALRDTRTPFRVALVRVALGAALGWILAVLVPPKIGLDPHWGAAGLTVAMGLAGQVEYGLLKARLTERIGPTGAPWGFMGSLWAAATLSAAVAWVVKLAAAGIHRLAAASLILLTFAAVYAVATLALRVPESWRVIERVRSRLSR